MTHGGGGRLWRAVRWALVGVAIAAGFAVGMPAAQAEECPLVALTPCQATNPAPPQPTTPTTSTTVPAQPSEAEARERLLALVNAERVHRGLPALTARADVTGIASSWSTSMADAGDVSHNDAYFGSDTRGRLGARVMGENVARNFDIDRAHRSLMASEHHRANILDRRFAVVGFGAVYRDGAWWVTEDFLQPQGAGLPAQVAATHVGRQRGRATTTSTSLPVAVPVEGGEVLAATSTPHSVRSTVPRSGVSPLAGEEVPKLMLGVGAALVALLLLGAAHALRPLDPRAWRT